MLSERLLTNVMRQASARYLTLEDSDDRVASRASGGPPLPALRSRPLL